jgi:hypothetical protein
VVVKESEEQEVAIKVGREFEVEVSENGKWWSKGVGDLKWKLVKMESGGQSGCRI